MREERRTRSFQILQFNNWKQITGSIFQKLNENDSTVKKHLKTNIQFPQPENVGPFTVYKKHRGKEMCVFVKKTNRRHMLWTLDVTWRWRSDGKKVHLQAFALGHWPQMYSNCDRLGNKCYWGPGQTWEGTELSRPPLALRFPVHILHVHFEVVIAGELLMAQLALRHGPVRIVCQLVPAEHLLQAERQVTNLRETQKRNAFCPLQSINGHVWEMGHHSQIACFQTFMAEKLFFPPQPEARGHARILASIINGPFYVLQMAPSPSINHSNPPPAGVQLQFKAPSSRIPAWSLMTPSKVWRLTFRASHIHRQTHIRTHTILHLWLYGKQIRSDVLSARRNTSITGTTSVTGETP